MSQASSLIMANGSTEDQLRVVTDHFPLTFDRWLKRPFISYLTSLQAARGQSEKNTKFFQLNVKEMQAFASGPKKNPVNKMRQKSTGQSFRKKTLERFQSDEMFPDAFQLCQMGDHEMLAAIGNHTVRYCEHLFLLAEEGNPLAAKFLAELAIKSTKGIERVAKGHYENLRGLAAIEYAWPVMTSPVKILCSTPPEWDKLGLGKALNLNLDKGRRLELNTPVGKLAWSLLNYVANLQRYCTAIKVANVKKDDGNDSIAWLAANLPDLTNDSLVIGKWWAVAERCLIKSYPLPKDKTKLDQNNPVFAGMVSDSDRRTPDRHRSRIIERLSGAFDSIAGYRRVKNKLS